MASAVVVIRCSGSSSSCGSMIRRLGSTSRDRVIKSWRRTDSSSSSNTFSFPFPSRILAEYWGFVG